uniref:Uncharacterized protein n=1 Tax=Arundo donax TaxID=35708 RepID=A0A0A8YFF8_ARUDO
MKFKLTRRCWVNLGAHKRAESKDPLDSRACNQLPGIKHNGHEDTKTISWSLFPASKENLGQVLDDSIH